MKFYDLLFGIHFIILVIIENDKLKGKTQIIKRVFTNCY